jgi:hypothetical protein
MTQSGSLSFDSYGLADYFVITDDAADRQLQQRGFRNIYQQRLLGTAGKVDGKHKKTGQTA